MIYKNIKLLEDRVAKAAKRLKVLSDEKVALNLEAESLRQDLAAAQNGKSAGTSEKRYASERLRLASKLREARDLLREA